jgi:hypothetical protein
VVPAVAVQFVTHEMVAPEIAGVPDAVLVTVPEMLTVLAMV